MEKMAKVFFFEMQFCSELDPASLAFTILFYFIFLEFLSKTEGGCLKSKKNGGGAQAHPVLALGGREEEGRGCGMKGCAPVERPPV